MLGNAAPGTTTPRLVRRRRRHCPLRRCRRATALLRRLPEHPAPSRIHRLQPAGQFGGGLQGFGAGRQQPAERVHPCVARSGSNTQPLPRPAAPAAGGRRTGRQRLEPLGLCRWVQAGRADSVVPAAQSPLLPVHAAVTSDSPPRPTLASPSVPLFPQAAAPSRRCRRRRSPPLGWWSTSHPPRGSPR